MELNDFKLTDLKTIAIKLNLKGIHNIKKADLIQKIELAERNRQKIKKLKISQRRGVNIALNILKKDLSQIKSIKTLKSGKISLTTDKNKTLRF